ncbi:MAG TPA: hypothetical protein VIS51_05705 [Solirubrobacterales bacterium]
MDMIRRYLPPIIALGATLLALHPAVAAADAPSGEFTHAVASVDLTSGGIAGAASWDHCEWEGGETSCTWLPYVTVGPGTNEAECSLTDRHLGQLGEGVALVWEGAGSTVPEESVTFDIAGFPIPDQTAQLACLSMVEVVYEPFPCLPGIGCLPFQVIGFTTRYWELDAIFLKAETSEPTGTPPATLPAASLAPPQGSSSSQATKARRCPKGKRRVIRKGKAVCRHRGRHRNRASHN